MRKLIILTALFITPLITLSQSVNENKDGFTEVIEVDLTQEEIYGKIKEWVVINYKSAKDVIQLDSKEKVIIKGNQLINIISSSIPMELRLNHTITFSIRDNKYKVDYIPSGASYTAYPDVIIPNYVYLDLLNSLSKEEYISINVKRSKELLMSMGWKGQRLEKGMKKTEEEFMKYGYDNYIKNKKSLISKVEATYLSIKNNVKQSTDDDW